MQVPQLAATSYTGFLGLNTNFLLLLSCSFAAVKNNNVIKKLPEGTSLGGMDLISGYPTAEDNFKRVWNLKDLKIEK
jgi:hypothetical protein